MTRRGRALARNFSSVVAGKAVVVTIGLVTLGLLTRHLEAEGFGAYRTILTYLALTAVFADLGLYVIVVREISRPGADASRILGTAITLRLCATASILLLGVLASWALPYDSNLRRGLLVGALGITAFQGNELLVGVFQRQLAQGRAALAEVAGAIVMLSLVFGISRGEGGTVPMIGAMTAGHLTTLALSWTMARRLIPFRPSMDARVAKRLIRAGVPIAISGILGHVILRGDTVLLSIFKPSQDVGYYGVGTKIFEVVTTLPFLFAGLLMPMFSQYAFEDRPRYADVLERGLQVSAIGAGAVLLGFLTSADEIVRVVAGPEFLPGASSLRILALAMFWVFLSLVLRFALTARDMQKTLLWVDAAGAAVAVSAYLVLIPRFSFRGAAWGTVAAEAVILGGLTWLAWRVGARGLRWPFLFRLGLAGSVAAASYLILRRAVPPELSPDFVWFGVLCVVELIYLALLVVLRAKALQWLRVVLRSR